MRDWKKRESEYIGRIEAKKIKGRKKSSGSEETEIENRKQR